MSVRVDPSLGVGKGGPRPWVWVRVDTPCCVGESDKSLGVGKSGPTLGVGESDPPLGVGKSGPALLCG